MQTTQGYALKPEHSSWGGDIRFSFRTPPPPSPAPSPVDEQIPTTSLFCQNPLRKPLLPASFFLVQIPTSYLLRYPASRGPSIFLDKSGRGRDLCQPPRLSLICRSSTETDESVRFETSFIRFGTVRMCLPRNC